MNIIPKWFQFPNELDGVYLSDKDVFDEVYLEDMESEDQDD